MDFLRRKMITILLVISISALLAGCGNPSEEGRAIKIDGGVWKIDLGYTTTILLYDFEPSTDTVETINTAMARYEERVHKPTHEEVINLKHSLYQVIYPDGAMFMVSGIYPTRDDLEYAKEIWERFSSY